MSNRVAIVECILTHYREPIYRILSAELQVSFFAAKFNNIHSGKVIDYRKAYLPPDKGGLRWHFIRNIVIKFPIYLVWQNGLVRLALSNTFDTIIFNGNPKHISTWVSCFLARIKGKRILMWSHGFLCNENGIKGFIRKRFLKC